MSEAPTQAAARPSAPAAPAAAPAAKAAEPAHSPPPRTFMQALTMFTERFGHMMSRILLSVLYVVLVAPAALFVALLTDPLRIKRYRGTTMTPWRSANTDLDHSRRQD
ncbi:MAG: hypothetical protein U1E76_09315 [Planctomycetota bacterium]